MPLATPGIIAKGLKWMLSPESPFYIRLRLNRDLVSWLWMFREACREQRMQRSIPVLCELNRASLDLFKELSALEGMDFGLQQKGLLIVCKTRADMDAAVKEVEDKRKLNVEADILDPRQLCELEPSIREDMVGAVHFLQDAHLDPYEFVRQLARKVEARGGRSLVPRPDAHSEDPPSHPAGQRNQHHLQAAARMPPDTHDPVGNEDRGDAAGGRAAFRRDPGTGGIESVHLPAPGLGDYQGGARVFIQYSDGRVGIDRYLARVEALHPGRHPHHRPMPGDQQPDLGGGPRQARAVAGPHHRHDSRPDTGERTTVARYRPDELGTILRPFSQRLRCIGCQLPLRTAPGLKFGVSLKT